VYFISSVTVINLIEQRKA